MPDQSHIANPVKTVSVRSENGGKRAVVTVRRGDNEPEEYVFDYMMDDWSIAQGAVLSH